VVDLFQLSPSKHRPPTPFYRQNKTDKAVRYGNILFSVHTITEAKQYAGLGRAEPGLEPGRWIFQPGHLTWRALV